MSKVCQWDAIVCTCQNRESAYSFRQELKIRQKKGLISSAAVLVAVDDPKPNIGSGSAALNGLLCVAERLAALQGLKVVTGDVFFNSRILILLLGATFPFSPCGHAFMPLAEAPNVGSPFAKDEGASQKETEVMTNIDHLLEVLTRLSPEPPPGVWVCSTDMLLSIPKDTGPIDLSGFRDEVGVLTLRSTPEYAMLHGACRITDTGELSQVVHMRTTETIQSFVHDDGSCDMLSGVVYIGPVVAEKLLELHTKPPLDACTYIGLDNGAQPLSLSLFFDILTVMTTEIDKNSFVDGSFKQNIEPAPEFRGALKLFVEISPSSGPLMRRAREKLWESLRGTKMRALRLVGAQHRYLQMVASDVLTRYHQGHEDLSRTVNSITHPETKLGSGSVLINCHIKTPVIVGSNCFLSGLGDKFSELQTSRHLLGPLTVPDNLSIQEIHIALGHWDQRTRHTVVVAYGVNDRMNTSYVEGETAATFGNQPWKSLFQRTGIQASDLWLPGAPKTLFHAKLYVAAHTSADVGINETMWLVWNGQDMLDRWRSSWRVSLWDILTCVDCNAEFTRMRGINFELQRNQVMASLRANKPDCFLLFFKASLIEKRHHEILTMLDQVVEEVISNPLVVCRVYSCIADMLGYMAGEAGIRGGPAANHSWQRAFSLIEEHNLLEGTKALAAERVNWIERSSGPDRVIRASRHYEKAGQILTSNAVATAKKFITSVACEPPAIGQKVTAMAPARIDLAGAWSDTPPIAYDWGGAVTTLALKINKDYPVKAIAERISEPKLEIVLWSNEGTIVDNITLTRLSQLSDYSQPHAPGALLKTAFICAKLVEYPSSISLEEQLKTRFGCGFKLQSFSNLPRGSGMGTSSILGGCILAALYRAMGEEHSRDSLIHAVLHLEQLLTTGGGWQDQCGGLYGGAKISRSQKGLPVQITTKTLSLSTEFLDKLTSHLMLIYTGKTRLARNLLQDVIRNWQSRGPNIVKTVIGLVKNAEAVEKALVSGDISSLGDCIATCQQQKLCMAPGSVPEVVALFYEKAKDYIYGASLAGAGGGGFMFVILRDSANKSRVQELLASTPQLRGFEVYDAEIDHCGLKIEIN